MSTAIEKDNPATGTGFNISTFLSGFTAFALERWLMNHGISGAEKPSKGKKKRKKLAKKAPKNFIQATLQDFAKSYPDTPAEAHGSVKKWLMRQVTDPAKIWVLVEALGAARGFIGKLGQKSRKKEAKSKKEGKKKKGGFDAAMLKPLVEAGVAAIASGKKKEGKKKKKNKSKVAQNTQATSLVARGGAAGEPVRSAPKNGQHRPAGKEADKPVSPE